MSQIFQVVIVSVVCGVIGTATRNAMDIVKVSGHPKFFAIPFLRRKWIIRHVPFMYRRHLIGIVTAFVAIVTLGLELDVLHQTVIGIIATMSGSGFLEKHLEGASSNGALEKHLHDAVDYELDGLGAVLEVSNGLQEVATTINSVKDDNENVTIDLQETNIEHRN